MCITESKNDFTKPLKMFQIKSQQIRDLHLYPASNSGELYRSNYRQISQCVKIILNKIAYPFNKTYSGLMSMFRDSNTF